MRYRIKLSYCGRAFHGWQIQPSDPSVQQALENALGTLLRQPVPVTGAGRTDAGVNAVGYIAHFDAAEGLDAGLLACKLNAILPAQITVLSVCPSPSGFHARFDATKREYTYFLHRVKDPFVENFSFLYTYPRLDFEAMNRAAGLLLGRHDFRCFEKSGTDTKTSICTVKGAYWKPYVPTVSVFGTASGSAGAEGNYWYFRISADRFLRNMVRATVGTLLEVGRGKRGIDDFGSLILEADPGRERSTMRSCAGESVPGHALFLSGIDYPETSSGDIRPVAAEDRTRQAAKTPETDARQA